MRQVRLDRNIPRHPLGPFAPRGRGRARLIQDQPSCRGGGIVIDPSGYVHEFARDHPNAGKSGRYPQHRLVMECHLGRLLNPGEIVHHKNRNRQDNRRRNLELMTRHEHGKEHAAETRERSLADIDEIRVREALKGRSTLEAAKILGVNHQTLRNRFPHLLTKRTSPNGKYPSNLVAIVRELAADSLIGYQDAEKILGITRKTIQAICRRHKIKWMRGPMGRTSRKESGIGAYRLDEPPSRLHRPPSTA